jgi:hypothetical protein
MIKTFGQIKEGDPIYIINGDLLYSKYITLTYSISHGRILLFIGNGHKNKFQVIMSKTIDEDEGFTRARIFTNREQAIKEYKKLMSLKIRSIKECLENI